MLDWLKIPREETPVLVRNGTVLRNPSAAQVARELGLRAEVDGERFDLVVLGGGPAGLAAAVYGGSEGLRTLVTEAWAPGGQAGTSTRIENYLGFPTGISGVELTRKATLQARRFDAVLSSFHRAVELARGPGGARPRRPRRRPARARAHGRRRHRRALAHARRREHRAASPAPASTTRRCATDAERFRDEDVLVVGGGNSAGQAARHLSAAARSVRVVVRRDGLATTMSRYLSTARVAPEHRDRDRAPRSPRSTATGGSSSADLRDARRRASASRSPRVFVMIGAEPCTEAVHMVLGLDPAGYVACGEGAAAATARTAGRAADRQPAPARDGLAGRVRRRRRARGRDEARRRRGRRRRARGPLRPHVLEG